MTDEAPQRFTTAREHALFASALLGSIQKLSHQLENLTEQERLEALVTGGFKKANVDMQWTCELATAHATVALALTSTEEVET